MSSFKFGGDVTPAPNTGQEPIDLFEGITAAQLASLVPFVKIIRLDPRTGRELIEEERPLMYDLIATPQFGSMSPGFGQDSDSFRERGLVSLNSMRIQTQMEYGFMSYSKMNLDFTVHQPAVVFDPGNHIGWRALIEEGNSFSLEYGWRADNRLVVDNPVFNGDGIVDPHTGSVIRSSRKLLLLVCKYNLKLRGNGEVDVSIEALENGDIALRETRLIDAIKSTSDIFEWTKSWTSDDDEVRAASILSSRLDSITPLKIDGKGEFYTIGQLFQKLAFPLIDASCKGFGYSGGVDMFIGNFNNDAGEQHSKWGGRSMGGGVHSITEFLVPVKHAKEQLALHITKGMSLRLHDTISIIVNMINEIEAWAVGDPQIDGKPVIALQSRTIQQDEKITLVMTILDRKLNSHRLKGLEEISLEKQSKQLVFDRLVAANIPIVELGRANSLILDASLEVQPDPLFQAVLIDRSYGARKARDELTGMPDAETRTGTSRPHEVIPISILRGNLTMHGNFIFETYGTIWLEYFNSSVISGIYNILERVDELGPGKFTTDVTIMSEGVDPFNTRRRLTDAEKAAQAKALADLKKKKG